jgi:hypothetical protein
MRADRVVRQKSRSAARVLRKAWQVCREDSFPAGAAVITRTLRSFLRPGPAQALSEFDRRYGVNTSGIVTVASMDVSSPNYIYGVYYKASKPDELRDVLEAIPVRYEDFTFVDFGSGKGLALLVASSFPFRQIIGVEFAANLHRIAQANISTFRPEGIRCRNIASIHADAAEWPIAEGPLVCYFYEPFEAPVLDRTMANLKASWLAHPRPMILIYHRAGSMSLLHEGSVRNQEVIINSDIFQRTAWQREAYAIYAAGISISAEAAAR